jgi:hypothetical protein
MLSTSLLTGEKVFYCQPYSVTLNFYPNGGILGKLCSCVEVNSIYQEVSGLYSVINSRTLLSFFSRLQDPKLKNKTEVFFYGEIIKRDNSAECLILKSLTSQNFLEKNIVDIDEQILFAGTTGQPTGATAQSRYSYWE